MTGSLRSTARNPFAVALMGLLMLVFLLLGVGGGSSRLTDIFRGAGGDAVVIAGSHIVSSGDFRRIFEQQRNRLQQQNPDQPITNEALVQGGFDRQLLAAVARDQAEAEMLRRAGIHPAPALIDAEIRKLPAAFDPVTGKFSQQQFLELLSEQGLTPRQAEDEIGDEIAQRQFAMAVETGFQVPRLYAAMTAVAAAQNRDVSFFMLPANVVPRPAAPDDKTLAQWMKANAAQLTLPERRIITIVDFSPTAFSGTAKVDPKAVQQAFDQQKASLSTPETRSLVEIPVRNAGEGAAAAQRLARGEDPAAIARSLGVEPVVYADKPLSAIADAKIGRAAFAMREGQTAGPVAGDLGLAAIKVTKVTPAKAPDFAAAKAKIEADLAKRAAEDQAYALSQKFDDARQAGASIAAAAQKVGVTPTTVGPVTAQGVGMDGKPVAGLPQKALKAAFAAQAGEETDLEDAGNGEYFALRVDKVLPPALPDIASNRTALDQAYVKSAYYKAVSAKAQQLIDAIKHGQSIDKLAQSVGATVTRKTGMERIEAQQYQALGRDFLLAIFGEQPGAGFAAVTPDGGVAIARLDAVRPPDPGVAARLVGPLQGRLTQGYLGDLADAVDQAAAKSVKVETNLELARKATGLDAAALGASPGGAPQ